MAGRGVPGSRLGVVFVVVTAISAGLLWFAWAVRKYLAGSMAKPLDALRAARAAVLAQAGALTGAAAAGWYAGQFIVLLTGWDLVVNQRRAWLTLPMVLVALGLAAAGLVAQSWCRIDPPAEDDPR